MHEYRNTFFFFFFFNFLTHLRRQSVVFLVDVEAERIHSEVQFSAFLVSDFKVLKLVYSIWENIAYLCGHSRWHRTFRGLERFWGTRAWPAPGWCSCGPPTKSWSASPIRPCSAWIVRSHAGAAVWRVTTFFFSRIHHFDSRRENFESIYNLKQPIMKEILKMIIKILTRMFCNERWN